MGDTLYGKPYGLTREEMLKAHHVLTATATAKKTPYQLDLEIKARKPDIVPKVGDKVKIKSREWYEKWKDSSGDVGVLYVFIDKMAKHCGRVLTVKEVSLGPQGRLFKLKEDEKEKNWSLEMFEEVYPQELSTGDGLTKASDDIAAFSSGVCLGWETLPSLSAINPEQGTGLPIDWSKLVSDTSAIITLPDNRSIRTRTQAEIERLYDRWLFKKEPELQTIKKHRFIKLEKL